MNADPIKQTIINSKIDFFFNIHLIISKIRPIFNMIEFLWLLRFPYRINLINHFFLFTILIKKGYINGFSTVTPPFPVVP